MADDERYETTNLGRAIQMRRIEMGLKRKDLAIKSGLSYPYVSEIENGQKEPSNKALRMIASALEIPSVALLEIAGRLTDDPDAGSLLVDAEPRPDETPLAHQLASLEYSIPWSSRERANVGTLDLWLSETVRGLVRDEMNAWMRDELPRILRSEIERLRDREAE